MTTLPNVHRLASSICHRHALAAAAAAGLVGTLLAMTLGSASAMPGRGDPPAAPVPAVHTHGHTHGHYVGHGCFVTPHTWNDELAGPPPRCYTYVP
jgi:hypothetical protein